MAVCIFFHFGIMFIWLSKMPWNADVRKIKHNLFKWLVIFNNAIWFNTKTYLDNNDPIDCIARRQKEIHKSILNLFVMPRNS